MKKAVWISFFSALIIVNLAAWGMDHFADVFVPVPYRLAVVLSITMVSIIFAGAWFLVSEAEKEKSRDDE